MRGLSLIMGCKLLSLLLNDDYRALIDIDDTVTIFSILGYLFHPSTILFGPWISFSNYISSIEKPSFRFFALFSIFPAAFFLILSTCVISIFPKVHDYYSYTAIVETVAFHCR